LYWQSLNSDARQLLVRTTGDHYVVHVNPEQTKILFLAKVVHADRTDTEAYAYVVNFDGSALRHVLKQADSWPKFGTACYMKAGYIAAVGSSDGTNATSGIYLAKDDESEFRLLHQMDNVQWITPTPQGEDAYVFGTHDWTYSILEDGRKLQVRVSTWWSTDDEKIYGPAQVFYQDTAEGAVPAVVRNMYVPIVLGVNHWIAECEPIIEWEQFRIKYGNAGYWEYKITTSVIPNLHDISQVCSLAEIRGRSDRRSVSRDAKNIGLMDMQSVALGMTNPEVLYLYNRAESAVTETKAAKNWSKVDKFALVNLT
jgi:hypothetical protein